MGLCKCQKRKVTNLFCFEHDVNVCEYCLVADHEGCIVQSYVQWLQDSDYQPICILCKNLLKDEPTVRLVCYDVFHWSCLDKYMTELPANTAPAGYQCPKCKECIFPPPNLVSPVVDLLKKKLEATSWSRVGLGQSLISIEDSITSNIEEAVIANELNNQAINISNSLASNSQTPATDDESNGFVIVNGKKKQAINDKITPNPTSNSNLDDNNQGLFKNSTQDLSNKLNPVNQQQQQQHQQQIQKKNSKTTNKAQEKDNNDTIQPSQSVYHNRGGVTQTNQENSYYDGSLGVFVNMDNVDRDTGDYKYQRRPLFEWLARWLKSRQLSARSPLFRLTRQKKILFIIVLIFMCFFTLIIVFSRLGSMNTENDPALDPMNNPWINNQ